MKELATTEHDIRAIGEIVSAIENADDTVKSVHVDKIKSITTEPGKTVGSRQTNVSLSLVIRNNPLNESPPDPEETREKAEKIKGFHDSYEG